MNGIATEEIDFFNENGYLIKRNFVSKKILSEMNQVVQHELKNRVKPFELEQEVQYPGSPRTIESKGGKTIRRLLLAYQRSKVFEDWAANEKVVQMLKALLKSQELFFVPSHHNCIMTKQPDFSSETHWHKDVRYWHFTTNQLITTWLPLGDEKINNGCLHVIPGSHKWSASAELLDGRLFLREDLAETQKWIEKAVTVELHQGDLLFFHAALFHSAGKNHSKTSKNALVFTYHGEATKPIEGTKSVKYPEACLSN